MDVNVGYSVDFRRSQLPPIIRALIRLRGRVRGYIIREGAPTSWEPRTGDPKHLWKNAPWAL
jgi:hypothetical protein